MSKWIEITVAARVVSFENGEVWHVDESHKMGLGSIELRDTQRAGLHVVRKSGRGQFTYSLRLPRDGKYRLGADRGHRVVPASEETDPIKRVLREVGVSIALLRRETEPQLVGGERWYDNRHCPVGRNTNDWVHDGQEETLSSERLEAAHGYFQGGGERTVAITGATYAINMAHGRYMNGSAWSRPTQIVVWPSCQPRELGNALARLVYGEPADADFPRALEDFDAAQEWVAKKFTITPDPNSGNNVLVDGKPFEVDSRYVRHPWVLGQLVAKHSVRLLEPYMGEEQRAFARAKADVKAAAQYVLTHYRVVAVTTGEAHGLKFARKETPDVFGYVGSNYLMRGEDTVLESLRNIHGQALDDALFVQAPDKEEHVPRHGWNQEFRLRDGNWETDSKWETGEYRPGNFRVVGTEADCVRVGLGESDFAKNLLCLSQGRRGAVGSGRMGGIHACLCEGDAAYFDNYVALLPVRMGETKRFVFLIAHAWSDPGAGASVWGVEVTRTAEGVRYRPYDNGHTYTHGGYWGGEVQRA